MIKVDRTPTPPASLAIEKRKGKDGSYRERDVIEQLAHDFHEKCYLCEIGELQSVQVEHLKAHHGGKDLDRMFDWNNLFLSCAHCNGIKNKREYDETILDCCAIDPEAYLEQELLDGHIMVSALEPVAQPTAKLITECFEQTNTGIRTLESKTRVNALQRTMTVLYRNLEAYQSDPTPKTLRVLRGMLARSHPFAGFTRTYVCHHLHEYPGLKDLC